MKCNHCNSEFEIYDEDREFLKMFDVPEPKQCPDCRLVRRLMERNAKLLYYRTCDFDDEKTLSQYHSLQPFPVYCPKHWWSDECDSIDYGQDFNFNRPFFEQFWELKKKVPHCALFTTQSTIENSDFNNCAAYLKNCYLIAESDFCEDCYYSNLLKKTKNLVDCSVCYDDELCYECIDCMSCYRCIFSQDCKNCTDSFFLKNCIGCQNCIGSINLRHKQYMIFNEQYSREEYKKRKEKFALDTQKGIQILHKKSHAFFLTQPHRALIAEHNENSCGDHLFNSKNAFMCFDCKDIEDCRYCAKLSLSVKTSMDYNSWGETSELMYQCCGSGGHNYNMKFCVLCQRDMRDCEYCYECTNSSDLFGCVGLKNKQYCIFNKKYTHEAFDKLKRAIIDHMKKTGEYGEFFPIKMCAFGYNESIAMDTQPLSKEEALNCKFQWYEELSKKPLPQTYNIPESINNISNEILDAVLLCSCGKNYKIILQELNFYRNMNLPIPSYCPSCRHKNRMTQRNTLKLWKRSCTKCKQETFTSYSPQRPEIIYCEKCYQATVY